MTASARGRPEAGIGVNRLLRLAAMLVRARAQHRSLGPVSLDAPGRRLLDPG